MNLNENWFEPISKKFEPLTSLEIDQIEEIIQKRLPEDYVQFISKYGGCRFAGDAFVNTNEGTRLPIFTFFGRGSDPQSLQSALRWYPDLADEGKLPIADDMFGNIFVLDASTEIISYVDFSPNPPKGVYVSDSFSDFMTSISLIPFED
jgi:hypothetical protein